MVTRPAVRARGLGTTTAVPEEAGGGVAKGLGHEIKRRNKWLIMRPAGGREGYKVGQSRPLASSRSFPPPSVATLRARRRRQRRRDGLKERSELEWRHASSRRVVEGRRGGGKRKQSPREIQSGSHLTVSRRRRVARARRKDCVARRERTELKLTLIPGATGTFFHFNRQRGQSLRASG